MKHKFGIGTSGAGFMLCYYYYYYYLIKLKLGSHDLFLLFSLSVCVVSDGASNIL